MKKNKLKLLYIILPVVILVLISIISIRANTNSVSEMPSLAKPRSVIFNGRDWNYIEKMDMPEMEKMNLKASLLRTTLETGIINNNPLITPTDPLGTYLEFVDRFYKDDTNIQVPLAFAMKIADMSGKGVSDVALERYKMALLRKLKQARLIK